MKTDLAITGGVHTAHDVLKAMMAGAQVVEIASVLLRHGAGFVKALEGDLKQWMEEHVRGAGICIAPLTSAVVAWSGMSVRSAPRAARRNSVWMRCFGRTCEAKRPRC